MSVETTIKNLALDLRNIGLSPTSPSTKPTKQTQQVADSWEDEASDAEEDDHHTTTTASISTSNTDPPTPLIAPGPTLKSPETRARDAALDLAQPYNLSLSSTTAPPPTPVSPSLTSSSPSMKPLFPASSHPSHHYNNNSTRRPEKTTATANRLIAGALGIRAPPRTEEQRKYDRSVREAEIRKRNRDKEERGRKEAENERAREAVWNS